MNPAIREIHRAFHEVGIKHEVQEIGDQSILVTGFTGNADNYKFIFVKDGIVGNDVALRILGISHCSDDNYDRAYEVLNELQLKYRFLRFTIDTDGDINGEYDFPTAYEEIGKGIVEMCLRLTLILDDCLTELKKL